MRVCRCAALLRIFRLNSLMLDALVLVFLVFGSLLTVRFFKTTNPQKEYLCTLSPFTLSMILPDFRRPRTPPLQRDCLRHTNFPSTARRAITRKGFAFGRDQL